MSYPGVWTNQFLDFIFIHRFKIQIIDGFIFYVFSRHSIPCWNSRVSRQQETSIRANHVPYPITGLTKVAKSFVSWTNFFVSFHCVWAENENVVKQISLLRLMCKFFMSMTRFFKVFSISRNAHNLNTNPTSITYIISSGLFIKTAILRLLGVKCIDASEQPIQTVNMDQFQFVVSWQSTKCI